MVLLLTEEAPPSAAVRLPAAPAVPRRGPVMSPRAGTALVVAGLVTVAVVVAALVVPDRHTGEPAPTVAAARPAPAGITVTGAEDVEVHMVTYLPGEFSSWHRHPGLHAVAVLSGTLTVYGPDCQAQTFGPGQSYVGGQLTHMARNDAGVPLEMAVTYLFPDGSSMANFHISASAPAGCIVP